MGRFRDALAGPGLAAVAEFKRRSPSEGDISPHAEPAQHARAYERGGAAAISVLVDDRFGGSLADLGSAREASDLPLLAKGFFTAAEHFDEVLEAGADAALLILRDVEDAPARELLEHARRIGIDVLVEAHDAAELQRAIALGADPIGVNARDLATFRIDRAAQLELVANAPRDRVVVAESGVHSRAQGALAELAGADAILVGTSLMRASDPEAKLRNLVSRPLVKVCGLTRQEDVDAAVEAGADMAGFILARESPRRAQRVLDVPDTVLSVAVYVGARGDDDADLAQVYEREDGHRARHAALHRGDEVVAKVLDLPWMGDDAGHWEKAARTEGRVVLAGKLGAENVRAAIEAVRPWAVDAASSLEREPGVKDHARVRAYVEAARS